MDFGWDEVARLYEEALDIEPSRRAQYLAEQTTNPDLRSEVMGLLENDPFDLLEQPVSLPASIVEDPLVGTQANNCRLLRVLGEGGMGTVYEAVRSLGFPAEQRVAVKVFHKGSLDREAASLAKLEHSGIARLLDTGQLPDGQPILVMELVDGEPLLKYAAEKREAEKLELICGICEAVEAAHRALIAHRDIKPGNVLVTRDGKPKLLDFGISKSMEDTALTVDLRLTPRYASPEQLKGASITTATDIYSLGVVMYEMLTGEHPFGKLLGLDLARAICDEPVPRPTLAPDLASIVLKAMAREPADRYASALALREDIQRYIRGEAVAAMNATRRYRVTKFIRRQRVPLALGGLVLVLIGTGFGRAYWEARQAARRFEQVRGLAKSLVFEIHDEVSKVPGTVESRKLILARALEYLDQLAKDPSAEDSLQQDLAESYLKIGMVQGNLVRTTEILGHYKDARVSYEKAVSILERLASRSPENRQLQQLLGRGLDRLTAACARLGDEACEAKSAERQLQVYAGDSRRNPKDYMAQARWLNARIANLDSLVRKQEYTKLRNGLQEIATEYEALGGKNPADSKLNEYVAYSFKRLGAVESKLGNYSTGIGWYRKAAAIHLKHGDVFGVSTCEVDIAWAESQNRNYETALAAYDRALVMRRKYAEGKGSDQHSKQALASVLYRKGGLLQTLGRWREAEPLLEEANAVLTALMVKSKQNPQVTTMLAEVRLMLGDSAWIFRKESKAIEFYREGIHLWAKPLEQLVRPEDAARIQKRLGLAPLSARAKPSQ